MNPLESARAYHSLTPQLRETEILAELARNISASLDLGTVLQRVTEAAKELCRSDTAVIYLRKPGSEAMGISHRTGTRYEGYDSIRIEPGKGMGGQVLLTGRAFRTDNYAEDPRISKDYLDLSREEGYFACMVVPIRIGSRVEGLLYLGRRSLLPFIDPDEEVLTLLADHAAVAIQNARLFEQAERRRKAAESLAEVARLISQSLEPDEVGQRIADAVRVLLNAQSSTLFRLEPESEDLVAVAVAGDLGPSLGRNMVFPRGTAVAGLAVRERCPVSTSDLFADSRIIFTPELRTHLYEAPHRAVLSVPLLVEDRVIGVLGVGDRAGRVFEEEEISLLQAFADQAVLALENARLYAESQLRLEETQTLLAVSQAVGSSLDLTETLRRVAREMARALGADMVSAWLADPDGSVLRPLSGYHVPKHFLDPSLKFPIPLEGHRFLEEAWQSKSPVYSSDAKADPRIDRETFERFPHCSILFCPMVLKGEPIGGLFAIWWEQPHQFSSDELRLVEGISQQTALAIESARLYAETERRRKAAESLAHVGRLISQSLDPEEVGRQIVESLLGLLNARASILFRLEPESGDLVALAVAGEGNPAPGENIVLPKGIGVAGRAVQERRPVATPDILSDPRITVTPEVRARMIQGPGRALFAAPLIFKDVVIGALGVRDRTGRVFNTEETHLVRAFADQAAIALENSRLYAERRRVEAVATALAEVGNELVRVVDTTALNERIVATVLRVFGVRRATLYHFDPASESLVCVAGAEVGVPDPGRWIGKKLGPGEGTAGRAISERRPVWSPDVLGDANITLPEWLREFLAKDDSRSACVVPLMAQAEVLGAVVLGDTRGRTYSREELRLLSAFGDLAAVGTVNARLYAETERRRRAAESLAEVGRLVSQSLEPEEVRRRIAESVRMLLNALNSAILQLEPESGDLVITTVSGEVGPALDPGVVFPRGTGLAAISMQERRPLATPDMLSDPRILLTPELRARIEQAPQRAVLSVPLLVKDTVIGTLSIGDRAGRTFDAEEIRLVQAFAAQAAIALENARLYGELRSALLELEASQQRIVQTERLKALGELAGGVAHDFNNMLGIILGRAQLLRIQTGDRALQRELRVIEHAALDGARTVQRIQEFTRRRPARPFESVNLNKVVEEVVEVTRARWKDEAQARGFRYGIRVEAAPLPPVASDPSELREALTNLVFNALEAMPQGGQLTFRTGLKGERVYCAVADTGVGMPEEVKRRVFEPFFTTKVEKGSGLGLSVAYGIVTRHGGEIEVQSQVGQGSAFTIWLPTGRQTAEAPKKVPAPPSPRRAKILVIEDEPEIRKLLVDLLAGQGHTVAACADGTSGLARFQAEPCDLVITDLGMPGLSGWEVARLVKERSPETPVALITGWGDQIEPEEARANGIEFLVTKPFRLADVTAVVSQALTPPARPVPAPNARGRRAPKARRSPAS